MPKEIPVNKNETLKNRGKQGTQTEHHKSKTVGKIDFPFLNYV